MLKKKKKFVFFFSFFFFFFVFVFGLFFSKNTLTLFQNLFYFPFPPKNNHKNNNRIVPYINASIVLQLLATAFPSLKKLQREEGPQGQSRFQLYQRGLALVFAAAQAAGQLSYVRPYVEDWSPEWAIASGASLVAGAMILVHIADVITELKIGNG